MMLMFLTQEMM
uniref:Uncharacterized protein n=1 Tax=Rhizophora mucronata TaxID=61149 RepID=A0A2P2PAB3_RHIMU